MSWWSDLPAYLQYLVQGILLFFLMAGSAVVLSRIGRNPYWALLVVIPYILVPALWFLALSEWPSLRNQKK